MSVRDLAYWRARCPVESADLAESGITDDSPVIEWMRDRGWFMGGVIGRWDTSYRHPASGVRFQARSGDLQLAVLLVTGSDKYCQAGGQCPHDVLVDLVAFCAAHTPPKGGE